MAIDFTLNPAQHALQAQARRFAAEVLAPAKPHCDGLATPEARFLSTRPVYEAMVAQGFLRKCIPAEVGGECGGLVDIAVLCEELYKADASITLTLLGTVLGLIPVFAGGSQEQCGRLLAPFLVNSGAPLAAFASSEPGGSANVEEGPPAEGVRTTAHKRGSDWVISGRKQWISSATGWDGAGADLLCVVCRTDPAAPPDQGVSIIAVPRPERGIVLEHAQLGMGHRSHLTPRFRLDEVVTPQANTLGTEGAGLALRTISFLGTAAIVGVFGAALMQAAFEFALAFARREHRGGSRPIIEHQAVGYALAEAKMAIEAVRALAWRACHALDTRSAAAYELALASKVFGSETAVSTITKLMYVVGIDSYDSALPLAGLLQDALALPLFDGGNLGMRRRQFHDMLKSPGYDPVAALPA